MALSLERLEALTGRKLQRIGLSATQRPLEEVARFLGGADAGGQQVSEPAGERIGDLAGGDAFGVGGALMGAVGDGGAGAEVGAGAPLYRPVTVVNAGGR